MDAIDNESRELLINKCARAGYERRRTKTQSLPWSARDRDTHRRYREIVEGAFAEIDRCGYLIVPDGNKPWEVEP